MSAGPGQPRPSRPRRPRQLRVMVLNHFAAPPHAPGGTRHVELFSRLPGWDATVLAASRNLLTGTRITRDDGIWRRVWVPLTGRGKGRVLSWAAYSVTALARGLRSRRPDVVYASSPHLLTGLSGLALARLRRSHYVLEIRDLWPQVLVDMGEMTERSTMVRALRRLETLLYAKAEAIVVMTPGVRDHLTARGYGAKLSLIPNGADPEDFTPPAPRQELRRQFGLDGFVLAYTGAHGRANGLDLVLDAAALLSDDHPDVRFLLVGDGPLKAELLARARGEGLDNVTFMDPIEKREMPALLGAVDAGLHVLADVPLFQYGVSPNKLFDYMAAGLPVITNTAGEMASLVAGAGAGLAVAAGDIAGGVRRMLAVGPEQRARWGKSGRHFMSCEAHARRWRSGCASCWNRSPAQTPPPTCRTGASGPWTSPWSPSRRRWPSPSSVSAP